MYMYDLDFNDFVFMCDKGGNITSGGYMIDSPLLINTIKDSCSHDLNKQTGGGNVLAALKDLAVPAGLLYTQKTLQKNNLIKYENSAEVIEEGIYDKLLSLIEPINQKKHAIKTRRKREIKQKMSRKNKK